MSYELLIESDGPIAYWRLEEASGSTATDEMGNHTGTYINSPTYSETGLITVGNSVQFTGTSGVTVANNTAFSANSNNEMTYEMWVNLAAIDTTSRHLMGKGPNTTDREMFFFTNTNDPADDLNFRLYNTANGNYMNLGYNSFDTNTHHVVVTWEKTVPRLRLYVDGTLVATETSATGTLRGNQNTTFNLGHLGGSSAFGGHLDEVAIYNKLLTPTEIEYHYDVGVGTETFDPNYTAEPNTASISTATFDATVVLPDYTAEPDTAAVTTDTFNAVVGGGVDIDVDTAAISTETFNAQQTVVVDPQILVADTVVSQNAVRARLDGTTYTSPTDQQIIDASASIDNDNDYLSYASTGDFTFSFNLDLEDAEIPTEPGNAVFYMRYTSIHENITFSVNDGATQLATKTVGQHFDNTTRTTSLTVSRATLDGLNNLNNLRILCTINVSGVNDSSFIRAVWAELPGYSFPANVEESPPVVAISTATFDATIEDDTTALIQLSNAGDITTETFVVPAPGTAVPQIVYPIAQTNVNWLTQAEFLPLTSNSTARTAGWSLVDELNDTASNPIDWVYGRYNEQNSINFDPNAYSVGYQLPAMDNPWQPDQIHKITVKVRRPDVFWECNVALVQGNPSVYDQNSIIGIWTPAVSSDLVTRTFTLTEAQVNKITDWSDLWIVFEARYGMIILQGSLPEHCRLYGVQFTAPSGAGVAGIQVENTPQISCLAWDPTLTVTSTVPEPAQITFSGKPAAVEPALPIQDQVIVAANTQPFFRVIDASTKSLAEGWPTVSSSVRTGTANADTVVVGFENGLTFIDAATKTVESGWPTTLSRPPEVMAISADGDTLAVGTVSSTQTDSGQGSKVDALKVINMLFKTTTNYPTINNKITALDFSEDGTKLAVGLTVAPYFKVYNTSTLTEITGYPEIENFVVHLKWHQNKLFVVHRGGDRLTVITNSKTVETGWPKLPGIPTGADWDNSKSRIAVSYKNKLCLINIGTKTLDNNFVTMINGGHYSNDVEWLTDNVVAVAFESYSSATGKIEFINIASRTYDSTWEAVAGDIRKISRAGTLVKPAQDATVNVQIIGSATFTSHNPEVLTLQLIEPDTAAIATATFDATPDTPDISIPVDLATISSATYDAVVTPDDAVETVTNTPDVAVTAYVPTIQATAPAYKLIPASDNSRTALDAVEITSINLDTLFHDQTRIYAFRVGNISKDRLQYLVTSDGINTRITPGVEFSVDKVTWAEEVQIDVNGNKISDTIYMKVDVPDDCYLGTNTFLLDIKLIVGSEL